MNAVAPAAAGPSPAGAPAAVTAERVRAALREAAGASWLPWLVCRLVVLGTLGLAKYEVDDLHLSDPRAVLQTHLGLLGSDAGWYQSIALHGYHGVARQALRFFPLVPESVRLAHVGLGLPAGATLVVLANVSAFGATLVLYALARHELGVAPARAAVWLFSLAPVSFVFVMGYAEATFVLLATACFWFLRHRWWWWAGAAGLLAGLTRPIGCLLVVAALVEVLRPAARGSRLAARAAAVAAPVAGAVAYLAWVGVAFGDALLPVRIQQETGRRGAWTDPLATLWRDAGDLVHHRHLGTAVHLPWVAVAAVLAVLAFRRLPASYSLFAAAVLVVAVSGANLDSFERYALSAFPLVMAAATLLRSRRVEVAVLVLSTAALVGFALLGFQGAYVP